MIPTERLVLRPFALSDGPDVKRLAGAKEIADTTLNIPHPYEDGMAEEWISTHQPRFEAGELSNFAITLRATGELIGAIGLMINERHSHAELGYWIGVPYWNGGYCTEAARAVLAYGFDTLHLHRIFAHYFVRNPASGRVMEKAGMLREGLLRGHMKVREVYEDLVLYGITVDDWKK